MKKDALEFPIREKKFDTHSEKTFRKNLEEYFEISLGSNVDKLNNFSKFVPRQILTRFISKYELFNKVLNVQGSIIECGVFLGGGLMSWAQLSAILEPINHQRKIIGFDTFAGFMEPEDVDKKGKSDFLKKGSFAADSYEDLKRCIEIYDSNRFINHIDKVYLVKGDISKTMPKYFEDNPGSVISLLYLDLDLFKPTKSAIENCISRIPKGGIIAFDELNFDCFPGEAVAVMETLGLNNLRIKRFQYDTLISYAVIE